MYSARNDRASTCDVSLAAGTEGNNRDGSVAPYRFLYLNTHEGRVRGTLKELRF